MAKVSHVCSDHRGNKRITSLPEVLYILGGVYQVHFNLCITRFVITWFWI